MMMLLGIQTRMNIIMPQYQNNTMSIGPTVHKRVTRLLFCRILIVTFMLGLATFIQFKAKSLSENSLTWIYVIIILHYVFSFIYLALLKRTKNVTLNIYLQLITDNLLITALVYVTGGISSIYSSFYHMVIIYSALFLNLRGSIIAACLSSILYGSLLDLEFYRIIHPMYAPQTQYSFSAGYAFASIFIYIVSFYTVAFLISVIVEKEKFTRRLLAKKASEFNKLDLLHRRIIESVGLGIITIDLSGRIQSMNQAAQSITEKQFETVFNQPITKTLTFIPDTCLSSKKQQKEPTEKEIHYWSNNEERIFSIAVTPLLDRKQFKIGEIIIIRDVTLIKEMEAETQKSKQLALIGEMAAGLAHEIRNPLASLGGSIQLLQKNLTLDLKNKRLMNIILRGRKQLENLVKDFLLLSKNSPKRMDEIHICHLIKETIESIKYAAAWNDNIHIQHMCLVENIITGNQTEIKEVIWNLTINAVQSMPDGGSLVIKSYEMNTKEGPHVSIQISDTGCGIENKAIGDIFTPFYTTKERGTGLGLAIVNRITESHGGKLSIKSTVGKGSCFTILLPISRKS
ncbi:MAG: two-component system, NtrC family, sensor histidine kinase PilS [Candidatus Magnetoglobus multicellularis str. Araruama]|uniref:histidine kinase n=1 Tax=Candidatus Magnetoglobus multicellularis str. Araruama TaxID=890399 RepID=A0A1V1P9S9_9BACT|nr:MAG: two-component system, NtrC family, sensor histidine kinase PilS [Candidatus Magnetoglobus multicellularis str. Araruama]